jgi:hypothetical protein
MNTAEALAGVSLLLLILRPLTDRFTSEIDLPVFSKQVKDYTGLGIQNWFGDSKGPGPNLGPGRTQTVLRMASLSASARAALSSQLVALLGLAFTLGIVAIAKPVPYLKGLRIAAAAIFCFIVLIVIVMLLIKLGSGNLKPIPVLPDHTDIFRRLKAYRGRIFNPNHLTMYTTLTLVANIVTVVTVFGL